MGQALFWEDDGQLRSRKNYNDGMLDGVQEWKNLDGTISQCVFQNGFMRSEKTIEYFTEEVKVNKEEKKKITLKPKKKGGMKV